MLIPNLKIEEMFKSVRNRVSEISTKQYGVEQLSWEYSSLVGDFYFSVTPQPVNINVMDEEVFRFICARYKHYEDMVLYLALCNACLKDAGAMPLAEIMTQHKYLGLPSFESISRTRRKLQARYPELAGSRPVQKMRATGEKAYRRYAKE